MKYLKLNLLFTLFVISMAWAYKPSAISYNQGEFQNYLIPHSEQIIGDYYEMIPLIIPNIPNAKSIYQSISKIQKSFINIHQCKENCQEYAESLFDSHRNLEKEILSLKDNNQLKILEELKTQYFLTAIYSEMLLTNISLKKKTNLLLIEPSFNQLFLKFNFYLFSQMPDHLKIIFEEYWNFFIKKLYTNMVIKPEYDFYRFNINDLNFQFNEFNLKMGKRNAANSSEVKSKMAQMTNQWNVILKIILKL